MTDKLILKPNPPADDDCCGSACDPCVWDFYYDDLAKWQAQQAEIKAKEASENNNNN